MKYENYNEVVKLVSQLEKHKQQLEQLNENLLVRIFPHTSGCSFHDIDTDADSSHPYAEYAREFITKIKIELQCKIAELHSKIETL